MRSIETGLVPGYIPSSKWFVVSQIILYWKDISLFFYVIYLLFIKNILNTISNRIRFCDTDPLYAMYIITGILCPTHVLCYNYIDAGASISTDRMVCIVRATER